MIALAFIFCDDPQRFEGYRAGAARPSRTLIDYMEHADRQDAQAKIRRRNAVMRRFDATQGKTVQMLGVQKADTALVPAPEAAGIRVTARLWAWGRCSLSRY